MQEETNPIGPAFAFAQAHHLNLNDLLALIAHYVDEATA